MSTKTDKSISINSVELEIGGTKIKLTLEQVAELKKILAKAFPEPETKTVFVPGPERVVERTRPYPIPYFHNPNPPKWDQWEVTFNSDIMRLAAGH